MTQLSELVKNIWNNSPEISFGNRNSWNPDVFLKDWVKKNSDQNFDQLSNKGWYWILSNLSYEDLLILKKPLSLPRKACDFGEVCKNNLEIFGYGNLYPNTSDYKVVYNGHEGLNVIMRLRAHYALKNQNTGALGIIHYGLSKFSWKVRVFTDHHISSILVKDQERVRTLINTKTGRRSIESAWRTNFGWPILSKE